MGGDLPPALSQASLGLPHSRAQARLVESPLHVVRLRARLGVLSTGTQRSEPEAAPQPSPGSLESPLHGARLRARLGIT